MNGIIIVPDGLVAVTQQEIQLRVMIIFADLLHLQDRLLVPALVVAALRIHQLPLQIHLRGCFIFYLLVLDPIHIFIHYLWKFYFSRSCQPGLHLLPADVRHT